jgi:CopG family transcriptional regulator, nickel-responsive regulator
MQRITITIDDDLMMDLDRLIAKRGYQNRSEAIWDLARAGMQQALEEAGTGRDCVRHGAARTCDKTYIGRRE